MDIGLKLQAVLGLVVFLAIAWLVSENRKIFKWKTALVALGLQFFLALFMLKVGVVQDFFFWLNGGVVALENATVEGTKFVFGYLGGGDLPFEMTGAPGTDYVFALRALPLILIIGALTALLTYWKVLPLIINGFSLLLRKTMGIGGAVGLAAGANVFVGMVESPMFIRDYLDRLSRTELFVVMTLGMSTIAGTVLILFVNILSGVLPNALGHLLIASIISLPAAISIAMIMVPEAEDAKTDVQMPPKHDYAGSMDAIVQGTMSAGKVLMSVIVMLIVFVALVAIVNSILGALPDVGGAPISVERMMAWIMAPVCWLMGIPWEDAKVSGELMGIKTVLNELLAFIQLSQMDPSAMSERSRIILSYGLCGFSNFGALGILIGGLTALAPNRREEIAALGLRAILSGTLATCSTAAIVSLII